MPINLIPLLPLVEELGITPLGTSLPLTDGSIEFDERHSTTELAMTSAWDSRIVLPPQDIVTGFRVVGRSGDVRRGWTDGSAPLSIGGYTLDGAGEPVFAVTTQAATVCVAGRQIGVGKAPDGASARLVSPFPEWMPFGNERLSLDRPIDLTGWRSRYWAQLEA